MTSQGPALTDRPLCHRCTETIQTYLDQLPHYRTALAVFKAKSLVPQGGGAKVSSSTAPATPINLDVIDVLDEIDSILSWGVMVSDLIFQQDGVHHALSIQRTWKKADGIAGFAPRWSRRFGKCERCDQPSLGAYDGEDLISCQSCGHSMSRSQYAEQCLEASAKKVRTDCPKTSA